MEYSFEYITLPELKEIFSITSVSITDDLELIDRDMILLTIISGMPEDHFNDMTTDQFNDERVKMYALFDSIRKLPLVNKFKCDGVTFLFKGSKTVADIQAFYSGKSITDKNIFEFMPSIMASLYQPSLFCNRKYSKTNKRTELFAQHAPATVFFSICNLMGAVIPDINKAVIERQTKQYNAIYEAAKRIPEVD